MIPIIVWRNPFPPHEVLAESSPAPGTRYGFMLSDVGLASFSIPRSDPNTTGVMTTGAMVSIERDDGLFPWVGYVTNRTLNLAGGAVQFTAEDHAGSLFAIGRTPKTWDALTLSSGEVVERIFQDAQQRAEPPLNITLDLNIAPPFVTYQPRAEPLLSFLQAMKKECNCEWRLIHQIGDEAVTTVLQWYERFGIDRRGQVTFQQGRNFKDARLTQSAEGFLRSALAVGGTGVFRDRESVLAGDTTSNEADRNLQVAEVPAQRSPALMGTRVLVDSQFSGEEVLQSAARRLLEAQDHVREKIEMNLVENEIDLATLELGSLYGIRFQDFALGLEVNRTIRFTALSFGDDGVIQTVATIVREREEEDLRID